MTDGHGHGANYRYVSRKRRTKEDRRFITGRGNFVADVRIDGLKHVAVVSSPHPRANIRAIDTAAAVSAPGVLAVLTAADVAAEGLGTLPSLDDVPNWDGAPMAMPPHLPMRGGEISPLISLQA